ncbi:ATP/GTP-binding protein [Streptomyces sp. NRRL F-7442]|uniref:ATP/GTP-binding protein n=1 Tax=Streptomyces sp. NRRL F-7442 TaxID=1519498 RepID=UPI0006AFC2E8|nr:ATP/GTP-binding protein [Streptomyces sp. NRRL F-7442]KOX51046.1 ATP/GTP-binding protein [Streptomyces sp. NRRL F-7442]
MDGDGTRDARGTHANPVPRPAGPPEVPPAPPPVPPAVPPRPAGVPGASAVPPHTPPSGSAVATWLDTERPAARPGIWRFGYRPPEEAPQRVAPVTVVGMLVPLGLAMLVWSLWQRGVTSYQYALLRLFTPDDWWWGGTLASPKVFEGRNVPAPGAEALVIYEGLAFAALVLLVAVLGSWRAVVSHYVTRRPQPARALLAALLALLALSFVFPDAFPVVGWSPVPVVDPLLSFTVLVSDGYDLMASRLYTDTLYTVVTLLVLWPFARLGGWLPYARTLLAARRAVPAAVTPAARPRSQWPALRDTGQHEAADLLTGEVARGGVNDVDCARVENAFSAARRGATLDAFRDTVLRRGGAAWTHPSGARDLRRRTARHDLLTGQVRIGRWAAVEQTPLPYRDAGAALDPEVLGTSLLAVGPPGSGKTRGLVEPVTEALALQALTGTCAVVAVSAPGSPLCDDDAFDVIVRIGDRSSVHDLDPYAESDDPDDAAAILAEALVGDLDTVGAQGAVTALAQLLGPFRAVHGRFPSLPELHALLEGEETALSRLGEALAASGNDVMRRELDARVRQTGAPGDAGRALADRLALLNRPVFADFFGGRGKARPFSLRAVAHHPLRVRIDVPERGHDEASRLITRLILAQFHAVVREGRREHFVGLVLDDATGAVTRQSVRRIQRLRSQNAGVLLALRTVGDVPEALHGPLYGAVGCRMAFCGVSTWDGGRFAQAWGTEWVETTEVAKHTVFADQPMTRFFHAVRKLVTGKAVTTDAVTVRQVERERWSASELAHAVPAGHAVLSLTSVKGEHAPPLLVNLRG